MSFGQMDNRGASGRIVAGLLMVVCGLWLAQGGCIGKRPANPAATQPVTEVDEKTARPYYWLAQPATEQVSAKDFMTLWETCERVAQSYLFRIDRRDFRAGMLTTEPTVSKQFFEFWRKDAGDWQDVKEASVGTIRRTIYFQFSQNLDGTYSVGPKVLVERQVRVERKLLLDSETPAVYWYALRRDTKMEMALAGAIRKRLNQETPSTRPAAPSPMESRPGNTGDMIYSK